MRFNLFFSISASVRVILVYIQFEVNFYFITGNQKSFT